MAGINLQGGFGAGAAVDELHRILAERFREEVERNNVTQEQNRLAEAAARRLEDARQFDATQPIRLGELRVHERGAATNEGELDLSRSALADKQATAKAQADQKAAMDAAFEQSISGLDPVQQAVARANRNSPHNVINLADIQQKEKPPRTSWQSIRLNGKDVRALMNDDTGAVLQTQEDQPPRPPVNLVQAQGPNGPGVLNKSTGEFTPATMPGGGGPVGVRLSDQEISQISQTDNAVNQLGELRKVLDANKQYIGPVAGLQALNPWSDARKAQADIDRVKQQVGKALEGGVLRKEDEEKYKKILSTLRDTPSTAIYKVDEMIKSLTEQNNLYKKNLKVSGRQGDILNERELREPTAAAKTITMAELQKIAEMKGTDVATQKARYEAGGYVVK